MKHLSDGMFLNTLHDSDDRLEFVAIPRFDEDGSCNYVLIFTGDINQRKIAATIIGLFLGCNLIDIVKELFKFKIIGEPGFDCPVKEFMKKIEW